MKLPNKYKLNNLSLLDDNGRDYWCPDIVNYVIPEQDGEVTLVKNLTEEQKNILIGVLIDKIRRNIKNREKMLDLLQVI